MFRIRKSISLILIITVTLLTANFIYTPTLLASFFKENPEDGFRTLGSNAGSQYANENEDFSVFLGSPQNPTTLSFSRNGSSITINLEGVFHQIEEEEILEEEILEEEILEEELEEELPEEEVIETEEQINEEESTEEPFDEAQGEEPPPEEVQEPQPPEEINLPDIPPVEEIIEEVVDIVEDVLGIGEPAFDESPEGGEPSEDQASPEPSDEASILPEPETEELLPETPPEGENPEENIIENILNIPETIQDTIEEVTQDVAETVQDTIEEVQETVGEAIEEVTEVAEEVTAFFLSIPRAIAGFSAKALAKAGDFFQNLIHTAFALPRVALREVWAIFEPGQETVTISEAYPGVDFTYTISKDGIKEDIVLKNPDTPNQFNFNLQAEGIKEIKRFGGEIHFFNADENFVFAIPTPYMVDSQGERSNEITLTINQHPEGNSTLVLSADKQWLSDENRSYPVHIDPSVIVSTGIGETEVQFGGLQRKVAFVNGNWYAFYNDATDVFYKKSSDGSTWGSAVDVDTTDADNLNPSVWQEGTDIYVAWIDDSLDAIEVNKIDTASSDALGTKCTSASQGTIGSTFTASIAVADDGTVYVAYSDTSTDTEIGIFKLTFSSCTFANILVPSFDAAASVGSFSQTSLSWSHTTTSNNNRLMLVGVGVWSETPSPVSSVTYAGTNLTFLGSNTASGGASVWLYGMVNPAAGANTVTVNFSNAGSFADQVGISLTWTGVSQSSPWGTFASARGTSSTPSVNVTSASGDTVVDVVVDSPSYGSLTVHSSQTERRRQTNGNGRAAMSSETASGSSVTMSWTKSEGERWAIGGVSLKTASGLTAGDRPVLTTIGNNLHMIFQDGNLSHSVYNGSTWTTKNTQIAAVTDNVYDIVADGTNVWVLTVSGTTATNFYKYNGSSWSSETAPYSSETAVEAVSLTYDSTNSDLYAHIIKDTSDQAYFKSSDATTISWGAEASYAFTAGDLGHISANLSGAGTTQLGVVLRQGTNFEFATIPLNAAPTAPTTLFVGETDAQTGTANPVNVGDRTPMFSAICNDPDAGDIMNKYRIQVDNNSDFLSAEWDSGAAGTAMANCTAGSRSANTEFGGTALLFDGQTFYWRIKFWDDDNTEGAFSGGTETFQMLGPGKQMRHGKYFFNATTKRIFSW